MGENPRESHQPSTRTEPSRPKSRVKGLPKVKVTSPKGTSYRGNRSKKRSTYPKKKQTKRKGQKGSRETNFTTLNTTNVRLVKDYFETISPNLFDSLARNGQYVLYQFEGPRYEVYLVPTSTSALIKQLNKTYPIYTAGIHLGFMKRSLKRTHFERAFYISFEGGRFLYDFIQKKEPALLKVIQTVVLDEDGEKAFLYGRNIELDEVISETEQLVKKKLIFVLDQYQEYIGISLLMVKQAGAKRPELGMKFRDDYSRSPHFKLNLLNLCDAGQYLRKGK
ncbi:MAG: hypothetical protein ACTSRK_16955 [Promethearchaeota archaeon]